MRLGVTLARNGNAWEVLFLPSEPIDKQLKTFKAAKAEGLKCDEMLLLSTSGTLKRLVKKQDPGALPKPEPTPKPKK